MIEIEGAVVRPWRSSDAGALARHADNPRVASQLRDGFPSPYTLDDAVRFIARAPATFFCIEVGGEAGGGIGYSPGTDVERFSAELGYWLAEPFWGRGLMTRAVSAIRAHVFATTPLQRLFALPYATNPGSARVLEKAGFVLEGRLRRASFKLGKFVDQLMYAVTDADSLSPPRQALTVLAVEDAAWAGHFYAAALGWSRVVETPEYVELEHADARRVGLYTRGRFAATAGVAPAVASAELYLHTADLDAAHRRLIAAGAVCTSPRARRSWGDDVAYYLDPFGHVLALAQT